MSDRNAIELHDVSKIYGSGENAVAAVAKASLSIRQNEFFTLLGPSGCGKTTVLRLIAGFEYPTDGDTWLDGTSIGIMPPFKRPINTVFQNYALFPHMSVADNIGFGLKMLGWSSGDTAGRVSEMLALVQMEKYGSRKTSQLSGGQQQRVALARALAPQPKVLLLDEPLSALDYKLRKEMQIELKRLQGKTGITFVFVTHDQEEALTMSDRIAVMSMGNILQVGNPREIYDTPADRFVADFIGETNFLSGRVVKTDGNIADIKLSGGDCISASVPDGMACDGAVTIMVRPEHANLRAGEERKAGPKSGTLCGILSEIVYFGTDTHFHVTLPGTTSPFIIRQQNKTCEIGYTKGDAVSIDIDPAAVRVLRN